MVAIAAASCGVAESSDTKLDARASPDDGVAVGRVVCTAEGDTQMPTPRIRARRDGVHILIHNRGDAIEVFMREADSEANHGGRLRDRVTRDVFTHAPGEMWIVCLDRDEESPPWMEPDPRYARFEIVDPDGLWIDYEPDCDRIVEAKKWFEHGTPMETIEAWVRDRFDIDEGERMRPGYPATQWKGSPWVIADRDTTFAYFGAYPHKRGGPLLARAKGC